ncbi:MAG: glutamate-5-semialdehyde dehydrogenase [Campylobacteraceae bacterium]|nr:glutamate-5-semialdehyde dehydrogenase [Campylobacteraceae bacterium]
MENSLKIAKESQKELLNLTPKLKEKLILDIADSVKSSKEEIKKANKIDLENAKDLSKAMQDRLKLDDKALESIINSLIATAKLTDPVGKILDGWVNYAGLKFSKVTIPIGVVCVIYESRPNVTTEVASLCLKSSNVCVLKGGSEAKHSNLALIKCVHEALEKNGISKEVVTFLDDFKREDTIELIQYDKYIDAIIPRGGSSLIQFITKNATIPVIKHDKGVCHIYVDESACFKEAIKICINAKYQKPSACNAVETILVSEKIADDFLPKLKAEFDALGIEIYGCERVPFGCEKATNESYENEYLDLKVNVKVVGGVHEAVEHITKFGSSHSEAILSNNAKNIEFFLNSLDSACLYVNASTRFSDGFEFGFGGEIGISTNKLHARGPMGLNELTTYKYKIVGNGQIRE